jgi:hypothetical protein
LISYIYPARNQELLDKLQAKKTTVIGEQCRQDMPPPGPTVLGSRRMCCSLLRRMHLFPALALRQLFLFAMHWVQDKCWRELVLHFVVCAQVWTASLVP